MMSTILKESSDKERVESKVMRSSLIVMKSPKTSDLLQNGTRWNWFQSRMNPEIQPQQPDPPAPVQSFGGQSRINTGQTIVINIPVPPLNLPIWRSHLVRHLS